MSENIAEKRNIGSISDYAPLIQAADGLTLSQVCAVSSLEPSTIQNWIKRGFVPHPVRKKYRDRHLARILLIAQLRESMQIERVGELLRYINGDADDTGDDIIPEEELFDLFGRMAEILYDTMPPPDRAGDIAEQIMADHPCEADVREKITKALSVMACAYMSNLYKQKADTLFIQISK